MDKTLALAEFMGLFFETVDFVVGLGVGALLALILTPLAFRLQRQYALRRGWRADRPSETEPGLYPEWQDYDPEIPGIAKKCICHGRTIHPGERVLTWPETGPMNLLYVGVYCQSVKEKS